MGRGGDVPLLHHAVGRVGDLAREHGAVLSPVAVQEIPSGREKDGILKVLAVEPLVVDGDLRGGAGVQRIEQFGVVQEYRRLVLFGSDGVVDIRKADALGELAPKLKEPSGQMQRMGMVSCTDLGAVNCSLSCLIVFCSVLINLQGLFHTRTLHEPCI